MSSIQVLAVPRAFDSAFHIVRDVLGTAARLAQELDGGRPAQVRTVTLDGEPVQTSGGHTIVPERAALRTRPDLVVVPGFFAGDDLESVLAYLDRPETMRLVSWLGRQGARGAELATGCTGVWLLAEAGVLDGKEATTTWYFAAAFRERYPDIRLEAGKMLTRDDGVRCAGAAMAHMDLALSVATAAFGADVSRRVASALLLDARASQAHFMITDFLTERSDDVRRVDRYIREHLDEPIAVSDLAAALHLSERTLARRLKQASGLSPLQCLQRVRVEEAARLLKTTDLPVQTIATRVGYGDTATLRRLLKRILNRTPSELRRATASYS